MRRSTTRLGGAIVMAVGLMSHRTAAADAGHVQMKAALVSAAPVMTTR
jgi:hypothetical protein